MKHFRHSLILLLLLAALIVPTNAAAQPDYLRLHVIANSDSLIDQSIKLGVRDGIREYTQTLLSGCESSDEAWQQLLNHQTGLLAAAGESAALYGYDGDLTLELGIFSFPDRVYGDKLMPAGDYRAVRIVLGEGKGQNWWCVVYPSLCLPEDADQNQPLEFYSSICRWALRIWEVIAR